MFENRQEKLKQTYLQMQKKKEKERKGRFEEKRQRFRIDVSMAQFNQLKHLEARYRLNSLADVLASILKHYPTEDRRTTPQKEPPPKRQQVRPPHQPISFNLSSSISCPAQQENILEDDLIEEDDDDDDLAGEEDDKGGADEDLDDIEDLEEEDLRRDIEQRTRRRRRLSEIRRGSKELDRMAEKRNDQEYMVLFQSRLKSRPAKVRRKIQYIFIMPTKSERGWRKEKQSMMQLRPCI